MGSSETCIIIIGGAGRWPVGRNPETGEAFVREPTGRRRRR